MTNVKRILISIVAASACLLGPTAQAEQAIEVGVLTCDTVPGTGYNLIIRSTVDVTCTFTGSSGFEENYRGETGIGLGVDLNLDRDASIAFTVLAAGDVDPGNYALAGKYVGGKASVTVGVGLGAAVLVGGGDKSFGLQPLALEGSTGLGLSGGIGYLYIEPASR